MALSAKINDLSKILAVLVVFLVYSSFCFGQDLTEEDAEVRTVLDPSPFASARAAGMGGALSTVADGGESIYYNPAAIGGIHWDAKPPAVREFYFPYLAVAANENAQDLGREFSSSGGATDRVVGKAVFDAHSEKRQYGRASYQLSFLWHRFKLVHYNDYQIAAVKRDDLDEEEGDIDTKFRSKDGIGAGFSASDSKGRFYLGIFSALENRTELEGQFNYLQYINVDNREDIQKQYAYEYTGITTNAGFIWVISKEWRPALAVVAKNAGDTEYELTKAPESDPDNKEKLKVKQDLTIGFSVSPTLGKWGHLNYIIESHDLTNNDVAISKKVRTALELMLGDFGSRSWFALRAGYNSGGLSYGTMLNLGLIQFEFASQGQDIGVGNNRINDRRNVAVFLVNVTEE